MDRKERIQQRAEELLQERADSGQIATSTKPLGRFDYEIGSPDSNSRYAHQDDVTEAWKDAEVDDEQNQLERAVAKSIGAIGFGLMAEVQG